MVRRCLTLLVTLSPGLDHSGPCDICRFILTLCPVTTDTIFLHSCVFETSVAWGQLKEHYLLQVKLTISNY